MKELPKSDRLNELFEYRNGELIRKVTVNYRAKKGRVAGSLSSAGYKYVMVDGQKYLVHRIIFMMIHGYVPDLIDHKNQNPSDNRIENLRPATKSQNAANSAARNKSGIKGCYFSEKSGMWSANIFDGEKTVHLGSFCSAEEARSARVSAEKSFYGEYASSVEGGLQ